MSFYRCFCKDNVIFFFPCATPALPGITQIPRISWFLSVLKLSAGLTMHEKVPGENKGRTWNQTHSGPCSGRTGTAGHTVLRTGCVHAESSGRHPYSHSQVSQGLKNASGEFMEKRSHPSVAMTHDDPDELTKPVWDGNYSTQNPVPHTCCRS